jgi:hypothetical protein
MGAKGGTMSVIIPSSGNKFTAPGSKRWYPQHKAKLIEDVLDGKIPLETAMTEHGFSEDEFSALLTKFGKGGYSALRQTRKRSTPSRRRAYGVARAIAILRTVTGAA